MDFTVFMFFVIKQLACKSKYFINLVFINYILEKNVELFAWLKHGYLNLFILF